MQKMDLMVKVPLLKNRNALLWSVAMGFTDCISHINIGITVRSSDARQPL